MWSDVTDSYHPDACAHVESERMKEVKRGFLVGPFRTPPFSLYRVSPLGLAEGTYSGKMRLIVDLSDPHNSDKHTSLMSSSTKRNTLCPMLN